jgi:SAM-dependent methyltransferase
MPSATQQTRRPGHLTRSDLDPDSGAVRARIEEAEGRNRSKLPPQRHQAGAARQLPGEPPKAQPAPSPPAASPRVAVGQLSAGLWKSRPAWLNDRIATVYGLVSRADFEGYRDVVDADDYIFGQEISLRSRWQDAKRGLPQRPRFPIVPGRAITHWQLRHIGRCRLLDVGAGEGRFVLNRMWDWQTLDAERNGGLTVSGISARHYGYTHGKDRGILATWLLHKPLLFVLTHVPFLKTPTEVHSLALSMCMRNVNVERLLESPDFIAELAEGFRYDTMVSYRTFEHLQDPLGTLVQLHALLAHGGILLIDKLVLHGAETALFAPFLSEKDQFTKTGSGQT